ncbi:hypothetical protein BJY00DRAFT_313966 [Aspergillus carlsbadensis]|nr:hypothetical protein BJY00DRAFT_313966 [Aspergillus carlsbadensis]
MRSGVAQRPREVIKQPLPGILRGPRTTTTPTIDRYRFLGNLQLWDTFEEDALATFQATPWESHTTTMTYRGRRPANPPSMAVEHFLCGDEAGVQGRMGANIAHVLSAVCSATGVDLTFGDYKGTTDRPVQGKVPDMAIMTGAGLSRAFGELKAPWINAHNLNFAAARFRKQLGQVSLYMLVAQHKYAFLSTYDYTIFLKQEFHNGQWTLLHSRPIAHDGEFGGPAGDGEPPNITVRQAFWHLLKSVEAHQVQNPTAPNAWVRRA